MTRSLAKELGPRKIRVNAVNPGMVETEGVHAAGIAESDFRKQIEAQTPLGRIGQPQDIAPAVGVPRVERFGLDHRRNALHLGRPSLIDRYVDPLTSLVGLGPDCHPCAERQASNRGRAAFALDIFSGKISSD